jgi:hypothetical protein
MGARYEFKYQVDLDRRVSLQRLFRHHLVPGEHTDDSGGYAVLSQYYDGPALPMYMEKIAGLEQRMKVRLRTYGWSFDAAPTWFLEAKHKQGAYIAKRRIALPRGTIDPLRPASWDALIGREHGGAFLQARENVRLEPSAQIWYLREVLEAPGGGLRITWDTCLRALHPGEPMRTALLYEDTRALLPDTDAVLEIKAAQTLPTWLSRAVRAHALVSESISKYVRAIDVLGLSRKVLTTC